MRLVPWKLPSFAIRDAKIRSLFLALSGFVGICQFLSVFSSTNICIIHKKSLTLQHKIIVYKKYFIAIARNH